MGQTRFRILAAAGAALLALAATASLAQTRQVEISNRSSTPMIQFFASSTARADWGDDILGAVLQPGQTRAVTLSGGAANGCLYDLRAVFADGRAVERRAVNVCTGPVPAFVDEVRR